MTWELSRGRGQKANKVRRTVPEASRTINWRKARVGASEAAAALGFRRGRSGEGTHLRGQDERLGARKDSGFNDWVEGSTIY